MKIQHHALPQQRFHDIRKSPLHIILHRENSLSISEHSTRRCVRQFPATKLVLWRCVERLTSVAWRYVGLEVSDV
jgi:hypothetical protein